MRTVRRQGLTFRITQPHGLRYLYLLVPQGLHKGRNQIFSGQHGIFVESHCDSLTLHTILGKHPICNGGRYGVYYDLHTWRRYVSAAGFVELCHYYRPVGLQRERQPWLATVWRR